MNNWSIRTAHSEESELAMANDRHPVERTFCTTREAAEMLGVSLRTAQLWSESGLLEAWKTGGGHRRISRQSVERLLVGHDAEFPVRANADGSAPAATSRAAPCILVVEDDDSLRRLYEIRLRGWPTQPEVFTASDGYEALVLLGLRQPDLLIADLQMPGMDGFRMLRTIRGAPELAGMSIIVVSGLDADEIERNGGLPGDIPILPKPVPFDRLATLAGQLLAERQALAASSREA